jgi:hypothetical protein
MVRSFIDPELAATLNGYDNPPPQILPQRSRLKDWRHIATRCDRLAENVLSALALLPAACFWIN